MKSAVPLTLLCLVAIGCASSNPAPATEPKPEKVAARSTTPAAPSGGSSTNTNVSLGSDCSRICQSYVHYRRGAIMECEEGGCGDSRTNSEAADYGRELRDDVVAQCGESCPQAWSDAKTARKAKK